MPMELDEERLKNLTSEVMDHVYDEKEADGILARESKNLNETLLAQEQRSESMEKQRAGNNQSTAMSMGNMSKYIDEQSIIPEESFRMSNEYTIDFGRDSAKAKAFAESLENPEDNGDKMGQLLGLEKVPEEVES